jgi:hypothetical protein
MRTLSISESRRLTLPIETAVEAVLQFDRDSGGMLWQGTILDASIVSEPSPGLLLVVRSRRADAIENRTYTLPAIAAAIINYCRQARIPLPRGGKKTLEVVPEGFVFCIETTINTPRWNTGWVPPQRNSQHASAVVAQEAGTPARESSDTVGTV